MAPWRGVRARLSSDILLLLPSFAVIAQQQNETGKLQSSASVDERRLTPYNCQESSGDLAIYWSDDKITWCCTNQNIACDDKHKYDCAEGLTTWKNSWSDDKKYWCCKNKQLGCSETGEPFDCYARLDVWETAWSTTKKHWCCRNKKKGCESHNKIKPGKGQVQLPYDCQEGLWNFRAGWSRSKKAWCCAEQNLGCEARADVTIIKSTDKPVAKCSGVEKERSMCNLGECVETCEPLHCEFSEWSEWDNLGSCYGLCQRERRIVRTNNKCGRPCTGPKVMTKAGGSCMANSRCKDGGHTDCEWEEWRDWSDTCYHPEHDQSVRWRRIAVEPSHNGRPCHGPFNETRGCMHLARKDCEFSDWTEWTKCSASCNGGTRSRLRRINEFAENNGKPCEGVLREAQECNTNFCSSADVCTMGEWSQWQGCSQVMMQQFRKRDVVSVPQHSKEVFCEFDLLETKGCPKDSAEPNLCRLTSWSDWGTCSQDCRGQRMRNRSIVEYMKKTCHVLDIETLTELEGCGSPGPCTGLPCQFSSWAEWSECSHRCGPGITKRSREVEVGGNCDGLLEEVRDCQVSVCEPVDCVWGEWQFWGTCSKSCGRGEHRRERDIKIAPRHDGKPCDPLVGQEVETCNNRSCVECIDGEWGEWGQWGECSSTCKPAYKVRHRDTIRFPNHCGVAALGLEDEYAMCDELQDCSENYDCMMSGWSSWSDCSCKCFGVTERSRRIVRTAAGNGKACNGTMKEIFPCNPASGEEMPVDCDSTSKVGDCHFAEWEPWTPCSNSCGGGEKSRVRTVASPSHPGGEPCNDTLSEVAACNTEPCGVAAECQDCVWGAWGQWGECSKCGGQRYRHRQIAKMPNYCGRTCKPGGAKEVTSCHSHCADTIYCAWSDWTDASSCSSECGHSARLRARELQIKERRPMWGDYLFNGTAGAACSGMQMESSRCDYVPCPGQEGIDCKPQHCVWGSWGMWGEPTCTQLCSRSRVMKTLSSCGGDPCEGATVETKRCEKKDCQEVQDCEFSDWHAWSGLCINEQKTRVRVIQRPASNGGDPCCGPLKETQPCDVSDSAAFAVQDGQVSAWTPWSSCTRPCGGGVHTRMRQIDVEAANGGYPFCGSLKQLQPCNLEQCNMPNENTGEACQLGDWDDWGSCKDMHMQYRNRRIIKEASDGGAPCESGLRIVRQCETAVDCVISPWTPWTKCSRTCGGGQTTRNRQVTTNPRFGGRDCPVDLVQTTGCMDVPCSLHDAQVSQWTEWTNCDVDCGPGQRSRMRRMLSRPKEGGIGFYGTLYETISCMDRECGDSPQDCVWGEWTEWTECDHPCGGGQQSRSRRIARVPRNGGSMCPALDKDETRPCNTEECDDGTCINGVWAEWSEWEQCSSTCHGGITWRTRSVLTEANDCGRPPLGLSLQHNGCNIGVECNPDQDCIFGEWNDWGHCTRHCSAYKERSRKISQHGRGDGRYCLGPLRQMAPCSESPSCPHAGDTAHAVDCKLTTWSSWGSCDRPCGTGQMVRTRSLKMPGMHGGRDCYAELAQVGACNMQPCDTSCEPKDCLWSEWSSWGNCDQCDGQMRRHRYVRQHSSCGGHRCEPGAAEEIQKCPRFCHAQTYCGWAEWEEWTRCSASCGHGTRGRKRELRPMATPPAKVIDVRFDCRAGLANWRIGWNQEKKAWCCRNKRLGCEHEHGETYGYQEAFEQNEASSKLAALTERAEGLEKQRLMHLGAAWAAGSLTLLAAVRLFRRRASEPGTQGFAQLPASEE